MIKYETLIEIASVITEAEEIIKDGLTLIYKIDPENHKKLDEDLFYRTNQHKKGIKFIHQEVIEVTIGEINFKILKKEP